MRSNLYKGYLDERKPNSRRLKYLERQFEILHRDRRSWMRFTRRRISYVSFTVCTSEYLGRMGILQGRINRHLKS